MLIRILFLPTTNWLHKTTNHKLASQNYQPQIGFTKHIISVDDMFCEANLWLVVRESSDTVVVSSSTMMQLYL